MEFELDHFFVLCSLGAPEASLLTAVGLIEGEPNTHPGQGTANRRFLNLKSCLTRSICWKSGSMAAGRPGHRICGRTYH